MKRRNVYAVVNVRREENVYSTIFGDDSEGEPPVPIPNTEVKPFSANGT